jgi:hypothetical protein
VNQRETLIAPAYYFAFYVIEHYVDPGYRFAGLWSFVRYVLRKRGGNGGP